MADEQGKHPAVLGDVRLQAVAAESIVVDTLLQRRLEAQRAIGLPRMAAIVNHRQPRQEADIDAAAVIALQQHTLAERAAGPAGNIARVEGRERDEVLDFLQGADFGLRRRERFGGERPVIF